MLIDHRESIKNSISTLRDEITLTITRMSEDPLNEPLCDKFRTIRDKELTDACNLAVRGTENALTEAVESAETGMLKLFELSLAMSGKALDGTQLTETQRTLLHRTSVPFKEWALIHAGLGHLLPDISRELKACDADTHRFEEAYARAYSGAEITLDNMHYMNRLRQAIGFTATRLEPEEDQSHPNDPISNKLRDLDFRLETAAGGGLVARVTEMVDPTEILSAPPPPLPDEVIKRYDSIFKELYELVHSPAIDGLVPLRNTQPCRIGTQGGIRGIKEALAIAVKSLEEQGMEFPQYHSVADRGRPRR